MKKQVNEHVKWNVASSNKQTMKRNSAKKVRRTLMRSFDIAVKNKSKRNYWTMDKQSQNVIPTGHRNKAARHLVI